MQNHICKNRSSHFAIKSIFIITSMLIVTSIMCTLMGCAIGQHDDGGYVLGVPITGGGGSASQIGATAGSILSVFGVPGAGLMGTLIAGVLAALGFGRAKAAKARHEGERAGWDEAAATYQPPPEKSK